MTKNSFRFTTVLALGATLVSWFLMTSTSTAAEVVTLPGAKGDLQLEIRLPPSFEAEKAYSILLSPGDYYWKDHPPQPGWIVVTGGAFFGADRIENSKLAMAWLKERYPSRGDGFHLAGWSANSAGVFEIAMAHSSEILSVTGIAGMPRAGSEANLVKVKGIQFQFIVGERDTYWRQGSERWHQWMQKSGIASSLEIIPDGEHVMPEISGKPLFDRMNRLVEALENSDH